VLRLRQSFTRALFAGDSEAAERAIRAAMQDGLTTAEIDVQLIAPALFLVGEKWMTGEITVAEEHLASEIVLRVLALQREARRTIRQRRQRRVLLLAPAGERHVIGLHMAADLLYAAGYDTFMLGGDVPLADVGFVAARFAAEVVCFSATMPESTERLDAAIDYLHAARPACGVLLGGSAVSFEVAAGWGATACADVSSAVESVDALMHRAPQN
jgi:MerR family transcriptional regulator, light-induced transcriptional regulator